MSLSERGLTYIENFMGNQAFSHKVIASHKEVARELSKRIEELQIGKVVSMFGSGELYRLLKFSEDGKFEPVICDEILKHKRSLLDLELDEYNQLKNLPDLDLLVVVDEVNFKGDTKNIESINNFRLIYSDTKNVVANFPDIFPFDIGMIGRRAFEKVLESMESPRKNNLNTTPYLLIRASNSYSQTRTVQAWIEGFIINVSVPLFWNDKLLEEKYTNALNHFSRNIPFEDWYKFLVSNTNAWRSYYPSIYKEDKMKNVVLSRWKIFLQGKELRLQ